jgi:hypothetical protein
VTRRSARGTVLLLVLLTVALLTVIGIALRFSTGLERASAANEWSTSRAFYAADAGVRWAAAELAADPAAFLKRPEFTDPPQPFATVSFPLPSHDHGPAGAFSGDPAGDGIRVFVEAPGYVGRRIWPGSGETVLFLYAFELQARAAEASGARFAARVAADVEVGPLPADFLGTREAGAIIPGVQPTGNGVEPMETKPPVRAVTTNWMEP